MLSIQWAACELSCENGGTLINSMNYTCSCECLDEYIGNQCETRSKLILHTDVVDVQFFSSILVLKNLCGQLIFFSLMWLNFIF